MRQSVILHLVLMACVLASTSSCGKKEGQNAAEFNASQLTPHAYQADSTTLATGTVDKPDSVLTYDIATAKEAQSFMEKSSDSVKYKEGILPQMANDNLDYTAKLLQNRHNYFIVVDKPSMYVVLYDRFGRERAAYKMACSKNYGTKHKRRDNRTPEGFFTAEGIYDSTDWLYTDDDGHTSQVKGQFGPRFIRLQTDVTRQIGIHGTCAPWALGRRASHGCIRIHNDNILELVKYVEVGTPIIVNPSERDQRVNKEEGYDIPVVNIGKPKKEQLPEKEKTVEKEKQEKQEKPQPDTTVTVAPQTTERGDTIPSTMDF